jgi:hypothetical protein
MPSGGPSETSPRDIREERVVRVHDGPGRGFPAPGRPLANPGRRARAPRSGRAGPEEVPQADGLRPDPARDVRQGALVHLEEPEIGAVVDEERGGDAGDQVCPGAIVGEGHLPAQDLRDHGGGRRLPVRRGDQRRAEREPPPRACPRRPGRPSRGACPGSSSRHLGGDPGEPPGGAGERDLEAKAHAASLRAPFLHSNEGTSASLTRIGEGLQEPNHDHRD